MASKKKSASSSSGSRRGVHKNVAHQATMLLLVVLLLFLIVASFGGSSGLAGELGTAVHFQLARILGGVTFAFGFFLIWLIARHFMPERLTPRWPTVVGVILFVAGLAGLMHSFASGDLAEAAAQGQGGGYLGYLVDKFSTVALGPLVGRLLLFIILFIAIMLILDKAILPFLLPRSENIEDEDEEAANRVPVMGELKTSPLDRLRKSFQKPAVVPVLEPVRIKTVDALKPLPRSSNWSYPPVSMLEVVDMKPQAGNIQKRMETIQKTLSDFGIEVEMSAVNVGPTVTQFTLKPLEGVKLNQITARQDDLALALAAQSLRVEAPIPGKGLVGIEIPNDKKAMVGLRDILESKVFRQAGSKLALALGRDAAGAEAFANLDRMPHALIAGATGSGKSVCINSIILTLLINNSPDELRLILVDPKRVELSGYNGIPHLLTPVITEAKDTVAALNWAVKEMEKRYKLFQNTGKRNIDQYNAEPDPLEGRLPYIVIIIDELADLMLVAAREVENSIVRLAQMARAVGIHLIVATQRPSVDVITGLIKANIPTRIAFAVASQIDSRTIIDMAGAEKLLGRGDMLYVSTDVPRPKRIQGVVASEREITAVIAHIKMQSPGDRYDPNVLETRTEGRLGGSRENGEIDDDLFNEAYEVVRQAGKASSTLLQTRLSVGYARAARLIQAMEDKGLIGVAKGSKPREVYGAAATPDDDGENEAGIAPFPEQE